VTQACRETPTRPRRLAPALLVPAALLVAGLTVVSTLLAPTTAGPAPAPPVVVTADPLGARITGVQDQLRITPDNADAWAELGTLYVQEARSTVNPMYYAKADGALSRSLSLRPADNAAGLGGLAALRAAQHRFTESHDLAQRALAINPDSSTLWGTLADAATQLGRYDAARDAVQRMLDLRPGVPAFTRAEYVFELTGKVDNARAMLNEALAAAASPSDVAFCRFYLAELAFANGDPAEALRQITLGTAADPRNPDLLAGQAKAEAALGQTDAAAADYSRLVEGAPVPNYLVEAGEFFESIGRQADAQRAYDLFAAQNTLFATNGVQLDTDPTLYYADRGAPVEALRYAEAGLRTRPFVEMQDAYAWALMANGRPAEALTWAEKATSTGMRNALFSFHKGMIESALVRTDAARADLTQALTINPHFSPRLAPIARATLDGLR
jgi:tetratricopeptide (TPR) repeat protein